MASDMTSPEDSATADIDQSTRDPMQLLHLTVAGVVWLVNGLKWDASPR